MPQYQHFGDEDRTQVFRTLTRRQVNVGICLIQPPCHYYLQNTMRVTGPDDHHELTIDPGSRLRSGAAGQLHLSAMFKCHPPSTEDGTNITYIHYIILMHQGWLFSLTQPLPHKQRIEELLCSFYSLAHYIHTSGHAKQYYPANSTSHHHKLLYLD